MIYQSVEDVCKKYEESIQTTQHVQSKKMNTLYLISNTPHEPIDKSKCCRCILTQLPKIWITEEFIFPNDNCYMNEWPVEFRRLLVAYNLFSLFAIVQISDTWKVTEDRPTQSTLLQPQINPNKHLVYTTCIKALSLSKAYGTALQLHSECFRQQWQTLFHCGTQQWLYQQTNYISKLLWGAN